MFEKESQKIIVDYLKFSLKINQILIYKDEHIYSDELFPQIGIALKL